MASFTVPVCQWRLLSVSPIDVRRFRLLVRVTGEEAGARKAHLLQAEHDVVPYCPCQQHMIKFCCPTAVNAVAAVTTAFHVAVDIYYNY